MSQTPASPTPRSALSELVELLGKFLGLTAAGLIVLSTAYDFSFLHALGLSFEEVPSSMADHVRSAIVWAPRAAIYVLAFLVYEFAMRVTEGGLTEEEILLRSHNPRLLRAFRRGPSILFGIVVVTLIAGDFLLTSQSFGLYLGATVAWGVASTAAVAHPRVAGGMSAITSSSPACPS